MAVEVVQANRRGRIDYHYCATVHMLVVHESGVPMVALVVLSSRKSVMGDFVTGNRTSFAAIAATVLIVLRNVVLIREMLV